MFRIFAKFADILWFTCIYLKQNNEFFLNVGLVPEGGYILSFDGQILTTLTKTTERRSTYSR